MWLIGQEWKCSNVWSGLILIGRGLDLNEDFRVNSENASVNDRCLVLRVQTMQTQSGKKLDMHH